MADCGNRRYGEDDPQLRQPVLRLTLLAPDIVEAILEGRQPKGMQLEDVEGSFPAGWQQQRELIELIRERMKDRPSRPMSSFPLKIP